MVRLNLDFLLDCLSHETTTAKAKHDADASSLFVAVNQSDAFAALRTYFEEKGSKHQVEVVSFTEVEFVAFFGQLTNLQEWEVLELFDLADTNDTGCVLFAEFFVIVSCLLAAESAHLNVCLHLHGRRLFAMCAPAAAAYNQPPEAVAPRLNYRQFARLARVLCVPEVAVLRGIRSFSYDLDSTWDEETFMLHYFDICVQHDKERTQSSGAMTARKKKAKDDDCRAF